MSLFPILKPGSIHLKAVDNPSTALGKEAIHLLILSMNLVNQLRQLTMLHSPHFHCWNASLKRVQDRMHPHIIVGIGQRLLIFP